MSILKTIIPKKNSNSGIENNTNFNINNSESNSFVEENLLSIDLLEENEKETKNNRTNAKKNNIYNKIKILLFNLKNNEQLANKLNEIEKKNKNEPLDEDEEKNGNILPEFNSTKYKYTLFIELDETLVHYYEEGDNNYFVKVRGGTEDFIKTMSEFCEIIIVSSSNKEYTDIIVKNFNKEKKYISNILYKEDFEDNNDSLDFTKINRDIKKCIFICHEYDFFNAPKKNIVKLKEFLGEQNDKEIIYLQTESLKLSVNEVSDVSTVVKDIMKFINNKRKEKN